MTKVIAFHGINEEIPASARIGEERLSEISFDSAAATVPSLRSLVNRIRQRCGAEPAGATLRVTGRFVSNMLVWGVVYEHLESNQAHVEYLNAIHSAPRLFLEMTA